MANGTAPWFAAVSLAAVFPVFCALGQPTNADIIGRLMSDCVTTVVGRPDSLRLLPDPRYDFLRTAVVAAMKEEGTVVFLGGLVDTVSEAGLLPGNVPTLTYRIEGSDVRYENMKGALERRISLASRTLLTAPTREVIADTLCKRSFADRVDGSDLAEIEDPRFEITQGAPPPKGWLRRVAEPAVVAAASAVAVYLFFAVRSDKNESQ